MRRTNSISSISGLIVPSSEPEPSAPTFAGYRDRPVAYAKAVEKFFDGDAARLCEHWMTLTRDAQQALVQHSDLLLRYLGIKSPEGRFRKYLPISRTPTATISHVTAPAALARAATLLLDPARARKALFCLKSVLVNKPPSREPNPGYGRDYHVSIEDGFIHLLTNFNALRSDSDRYLAASILEQHLGQLGKEAQERIAAHVRRLISDPALSEVPKRVLNRAIHNFSTLPEDIQLRIFDEVQESAAQKVRENYLYPNLSHVVHECADASANAMRMLKTVSSQFHRLSQRSLYRQPGSGAAAIATKIAAWDWARERHRSGDPAKIFREKVAQLFSGMEVIDIDFTHSSLRRSGTGSGQIVLEELSGDKITRLRHMKFDCGESPDDVEKLLALSRNNPHLEIELTSDRHYVTPAFIMALSDALPQLKMKHLTLPVMPDEEYQALAPGIRQSSVTHLTIYASCAEHLAHIAQGVAGSGITHLTLNVWNYQHFDGAAMTPIAEALANSGVTHLTITCSTLDPGGGSAIAKRLPGSSLTHLNLNGNRIDSADLVEIVESLPLSGIVDLRLSGTELDPPVISALANVLPHSSIRTLDISGNELRDELMKRLAPGLPQSNVATLVMRDNNIGAEGYKALGDALAKSKVATLDLSFSKISDESAAEIAELIRKSNITTLIMDKPKMSPEAYRIIKRAVREAQAS